MKKILAMVFIFFVMGACSLHGNLLARLTALDDSSSVSFYCEDASDLDGVLVQNNGEGVIITCVASNAKEVYKNISNCFGYSIKFDESSVLDKIILQIKVLKTEVQGGLTMYYGLARGGVFFDFLGGQKINVQVAATESYVIVGSPIILGGY